MFCKVASSRRYGITKAALAILILTLVAGSRMHADNGTCGGQNISLPFNDVASSIFFCQIAELYVQGITNGTTPTTYSPNANVTRDQMAAFLSRTLDTGLRRGDRRAALDRFWSTTPHYDLDLGSTTLSATADPHLIKSDGSDVWAVDNTSGDVYRVRASDGKLLDTWTGATGGYAVLCAMGRIFITGDLSPSGTLYMIDPTAPAGPVTTVTAALGPLSTGIGFDGNRIWTANNTSLSIVTPGPTLPWSVTTVGGFGRLAGFAYDGQNMWVTDQRDSSIKKLSANGVILQTVTVTEFPNVPGHDGKNIWVPGIGDTMTVVRASTGEVLATLTGNGLENGRVAAFDGIRILVTNLTGQSVSLWKATDLTPLGTISTGAGSDPWGACSDGQSFWIALNGTHQLARF